MMHKIFLISSIFILCFYQNAWATSCSIVENINVFEFVYQNDVIFIGKRLTKKDRKDPSVFTVTDPLKGGGPPDTVIIERDDRFNLIGSPSIMNLNFGEYANKDMFLIYGQYDKHSTFIQRTYPACTSLPFAKTIIYFMKGPYKYRYVIVAFVAFFVFLIWRVGGLKKLVTADLCVLPAIFINCEIMVKTRPMRLKKTAIFVFFILSLIFIFMLYAGDRILFSYFYNRGDF